MTAEPSAPMDLAAKSRMESLAVPPVAGEPAEGMVPASHDNAWGGMKITTHCGMPDGQGIAACPAAAEAAGCWAKADDPIRQDAVTQAVKTRRMNNLLDGSGLAALQDEPEVVPAKQEQQEPEKDAGHVLTARAAPTPPPDACVGEQPQNHEDQPEAAASVIASAVEGTAAETTEAAEQDYHENDKQDGADRHLGSPVWAAMAEEV